MKNYNGFFTDDPDNVYNVRAGGIEEAGRLILDTTFVDYEVRKTWTPTQGGEVAYIEAHEVDEAGSVCDEETALVVWAERAS